MQLAEQQQQSGAVVPADGSESSPAVTPSAAAILPATALPEVDAVVREADTDMEALGADIASPDAEAETAQKGDTDMADATTAAPAADVSAGTFAPTGANNSNATAGTARAAGTVAPAGSALKQPQPAGGPMAHKAGMLGKGLADFTPALWSGPVLTSAVRGNLLGKGKPGMLLCVLVLRMCKCIVTAISDLCCERAWCPGNSKPGRLLLAVLHEL